MALDESVGSRLDEQWPAAVMGEGRKSLGMPSSTNEVVRAHFDHRREWKLLDHGLCL